MGTKVTLKRFNGSSWVELNPVTDWSNINNKPSTFTPTSHTHTKSQITDFPSSMPASDVYSWAKASSKPSYNFGEIGTGVATIGDGANYVLYRTNESWRSGYYYHTTGSEAVVFANKNASTSWIFVNAIDPTARKDWTNLGQVPAMQIKTNSVAINKLIANGTTPSYNLDVNGTANATTLYEGGTSLADKYQAKGNYLTSHQDISGKLNTSGGDYSVTIGGASSNSNKTLTVNGKFVINPSYNTAQNSYNEGFRVNSASNGWAEIAVGGSNNSTYGTGSGLWIIGKRGAAGSTSGAAGDFTIEHNGSNGTGLTLYANGNVPTWNGANLATQSWVTNKGYLTSHQDISGKADKVSMTAGWYKRVYVNSQGIVTNADQTDDNTTYNFSGTTFYSGNSSTAEHNANSAVKNGNYYYTSNGPSNLGEQSTDGALYVQSYSDSWVGQIAQDYRNGRIWVRGKNNGTWSDWKRIAQTGESQPASDVYSWAKASTKPSYSFSGTAATSGANSGSAISCIGGGSVSLADTASSGGIVFLTGEVSGSTLTITTKRLTASFTGSGGGSCAPSGHTHSVTATGSVS